MSYDASIFSYKSLYESLSKNADDLTKKLFDVVKTKNFELIMRQLKTTSEILDAIDENTALGDKVRSASESIRTHLLHSIQELHPEHVFKIPEEKSQKCASVLNDFLQEGGHIFTTNYDLLLYWVLMRQNIQNHNDGFGKSLENPQEVGLGEDPEYSHLYWGPNAEGQNVHYLHGALHLFDSGVEIIKEQYSWEANLLEKISARLDKGEYPIFVTAGDGSQKLEHIRHNSYLSTCYDRLCNIDGYLVTFGFNFGAYDEHIIEALNRAAHAESKMPPKLWGIYIGTYSAEDIDHIRSIEHKFHAKIRIVNSQTASFWGD